MYKYDLSIYVPTYNHEKFIKKALDSIFMQKTKYTYQVLVGEDCSTDNTREILKEYEQTHKQYIKTGQLQIFYRKHNMYNDTPDNSADLKARCVGRYIIALEGDDYWIDENKIEQQISFLDENPEYIAVSHNCIIVDENNKLKKEKYPECKQKEYTIAHYMSDILPGQLTTLMYRNIYILSNVDCSLLYKGLSPGDKLIVLVLLCYGKIFCMQKSMSAYRHVVNQGDSFSARYRYNFVDSEKWYKEVVQYLYNHKEPYVKNGELLYIRCIMKGIKERQCTIKEAISYLKIIQHVPYSLYKWVIYKIRKDIMHDELWV